MENESKRRASAVLPSAPSSKFTLDAVANFLGLTICSPYLFVIPAVGMLRGFKVTDPTSIYCLCVLLFRLIRRCSWLYRNQGSLLRRSEGIDWSKQVAVITGGASGLGCLLATTLAARNVRVAVLDVNPSPAANDGPPIVHYRCDVSDWQEVEAAAETIRAEVGSPTIIINNAGVVQGRLLLDLSPEDINQTFGVNTLAHFWTVKAFLPDMVARKEGHIVTVSSLMGHIGTAQLTDYCASKASLVALDQALRYELDHRYHCPKIRTTLVCPSFINTPMFQAIQFPTNQLFKFCCPTVPPADVVDSIVAALEDQHSRKIFLPYFANFAPHVNLLPSFMRDLLQWFTGADYSMRNFAKVSGRRPSESDLRSKGESLNDNMEIQ